MEMMRVLIVLMLLIGIGHAYAQTGPVLDIRMDEGDGATVADTSGNGNDGTHYGNTRLLMHFDGNANDSSSYGNDGTVNGATLTTGVWGNGLEFDGVDDYVEITKSNSLNLTYPITLMAWVYPKNDSNFMEIISDRGSQVTQYDMRLNNGVDLEFYFRNGSSWYEFIKTDAISLNQWSFVVATYDGTNIGLYANGVEVQTNTTDKTPDYNSQTTIKIGKYGNVDHFNGTIDEVGIYSKALSASEISDLYNATKAKFTDWTGGKVGNALEFDGVDDYVEAPDFIGNWNEITLVAWIKTTHGGTSQDIIGQKWVSFLRVMSNGRPYFYVNNGSQPKGIDSQTVINDGQYHFVAGVYDGANIKVFVDGVEEGSKGYMGTLVSGSNPVTVSDTSFFFNGTIDEVRIWNRALSEDEIYWQYHWNEYYPRPVVVPVTATGVTGTVLWTGLDQNSGVELSLVSPSGAEYTRDSTGAEARARFIDEVTVTLPVIDYTVTLYNGYKKLKVPATESGKWEFRVRSRNVTDMSVDVGWK